MQKKKGISLIVLVITIIVMIVLAGAIILSLNNAGIIGNANKAVDESNVANIKSVADLEYAEYLIEKPEVTDLGAYLTQKLKEKNIITGDDYIVGIYDNQTVIAKAGTVAYEYYKGNIKIGDYVNYDPTYKVENISEIKYTSPLANNGWANQSFALKDGENQSYDTSKYGWQVMGIDKEGRLLLLSEDYIQPLSGGKEFNDRSHFGLISETSAAPYVKGLEEVEKICDLYGHGFGAVDARCITLEDVNRITGYNPDKVTKKFYQGKMEEYNNRVNIYWYNEDGTIKVLAEGSNGCTSTLGEEFYYYDENNEYKLMTKPINLAVGEKVKIMTVVNNHYQYYSETLTEDINDEKIGKVQEGTVEYNMLFEEGRAYYLANKIMLVGTESMMYRLAAVRDNLVTGYTHKKSNGDWNGSWIGIRPVITLDENIKLIGNSTDGFSIIE